MVNFAKRLSLIKPGETYASAPTPLPGGYSAGEKVHFCGASLPIDHENRVDYSKQGKVVGADPEQRERRVMVRFPGNRTAVACLTTELSREWPPPPLPGDLKVGDAVHWSAASESLSGGDRLEHSMKGEVQGVADDEPKLKVSVRFPANRGAVDSIA